MKLLNNYRPNAQTVPTVPMRTVGPGPNEAAAARQAARQRPRLPRDAYVALSNNPTELHINLTITRMEHIEALIEALQTFAPQIEYGRQRDEDR